MWDIFLGHLVHMLLQFASLNKIKILGTRKNKAFGAAVRFYMGQNEAFTQGRIMPLQRPQANFNLAPPPLIHKMLRLSTIMNVYKYLAVLRQHICSFFIFCGNIYGKLYTFDEHVL